MAKCDWAILCDYAFLDEKRKTCMIGVFDRIFAPSVPATHHQAALALKLVGESKEKVDLRIDIIRPNGGVLVTLRGGGELSEVGTTEITMGLQGMPLPDFGIYAFNVYIGDELDKTIGITVAHPPKPQQKAQD